MIKTLLLNLTFIISYLFFTSIINKHFVIKIKENNIKKIINGLIYGILGIIIMFFNIKISNTIIVDLRHLAIILISVYGGVISALTSAVIIAIGRLAINGVTSVSVVASISLLLMCCISGFVNKLSIKRFYKFHLMNILSLILVFIALIINTASFKAMIEVYTYTVIFSVLGGFFIFSVAEYLYNSYIFEQKLISTSSVLSTLMNNLQSGILLEDENRNVSFLNKKFNNMFNIEDINDNLTKENSQEIINKIKSKFKDVVYYEEVVKNCLKHNQTVTNIELPLKDERYLELDFIPVFFGNKNFGHFWNYRDITNKVITRKELIEKNKELEELSNLDGLTQVPNRRFFDNKLDEEIDNSIKNKTQLALIMFDIDLFKKYNDTYGHIMGDSCLKEIAKISQKEVKPHGYLCRYGGEEFSAILPNVDIEFAKVIAENIKKAINERNIPHKSSDVEKYVTVSIGVVSLIADMNIKKEDIIYKADMALYDSKSNGRNKITIA